MEHEIKDCNTIKINLAARKYLIQVDHNIKPAAKSFGQRLTSTVSFPYTIKTQVSKQNHIYATNKKRRNDVETSSSTWWRAIKFLTC